MFMINLSTLSNMGSITEVLALTFAQPVIAAKYVRCSAGQFA